MKNIFKCTLGVDTILFNTLERLQEHKEEWKNLSNPGSSYYQPKEGSSWGIEKLIAAKNAQSHSNESNSVAMADLRNNVDASHRLNHPEVYLYIMTHYLNSQR